MILLDADGKMRDNPHSFRDTTLFYKSLFINRLRLNPRTVRMIIMARILIP